MVYSTDRLRVVRGAMRDRRQFLDRTAGALWPAYRQLLREYERVCSQRNAALETSGKDLDVWTERLVDLGARLRARRGAYVERLRGALKEGFRPSSEAYDVEIVPGGSDEEAHKKALAIEAEKRRRDEIGARRTLVGPHRDTVRLLIDGEEAALRASSGQTRSLLLALTLASLEIHRQETGESAVALLDDLDSELDSERTAALCREIASRGQALVTTAHPGWAAELSDLGARFSVSAGEVSAVR
jgi:DNA replication and repair protein RecF